MNIREAGFRSGYSATHGQPRADTPAVGVLVKVTTLDMLADFEQLRALSAFLACDLARSALSIFQGIAAVLEREQQRCADDIDQVL